MCIGSDVFMNCLRLNHIYYDCSIFDVTFLKQILTQITWDVEVHFLDSSIFYPEYNGGYDEVGPAHIFALNIEGEGFRMRQCLKRGKSILMDMMLVLKSYALKKVNLASFM